MGGDNGPSTMVQAACQVLSKYPDLNLFLVGDENQIKSNLSRLEQIFLTRVQIIPTTSMVEMDDQPSKVLRTKTDSSMAVALQLVADNKAQAVVSAGNTGALMAFSRKILTMLPDINRPAIISTVPTDTRTSRLIDLGANVDCSPMQLYQFAQMGAAITMANDNSIDKPSVALVNIGTEAIKGNEQTRKTHELLCQSSEIDYKGFIEGHEVYQGLVDVIVCDGFVGNVLIKASEGVVHMTMNKLLREYQGSLWRRLLAGLSASVLKSFRSNVDPDQHNGASLVGLQGVVIKSHGAANIRANMAAIEEAMREANYDIPAQIQKRLAELPAETLENS